MNSVAHCNYGYGGSRDYDDYECYQRCSEVVCLSWGWVGLNCTYDVVFKAVDVPVVASDVESTVS